jgi:UDP-3-O-[3-hydroxymyristoyl] N-acetylglucosamine deacetylase/3-hydroxyacyl-[acyl-carrier-protein] dehydratase
VPLKAHLVATRPGHAINAELTRLLFERHDAWKKGGRKPARGKAPTAVLATETELDIRRVLDTLPHRYPFIMIDRVIEIKGDDELVAVKNVTINEPYFQGHYPGNPVMPGVMQLESMAQAAGILLLRRASLEGKTALFMSCDKIKWRKPVRPGDQIIINVRLTKARGNKIACAEGTCSVDGQVVSSAELMFALVDEAQVE